MLTEECDECGERHTLRADGLCPCQGCGRGVGSLRLLDGLCQECDPEGRGREEPSPTTGSTPPDVCGSCFGSSRLEPTCRHARPGGEEVPTCPSCCPGSCPNRNWDFGEDPNPREPGTPCRVCGGECGPECRDFPGVRS